jgi:glycine cleavage system regulatory protein
MADLVLTLIGPDRPGLVEAVARPIADNGGNWLESRMAHLAGQFAGILRIEVPDDRAPALVEALRALSSRGLRLVVETSPSAPLARDRRLMALEVVGVDRPGIVREIARVLAERGVNIEELETDRSNAPMTAEPLFRSRARVHVPASSDPGDLRAALERVAGDLMVQVSLAEADG